MNPQVLPDSGLPLQEDEGATGGQPLGQCVDHGGADQVYPGGCSFQGPQVPQGLLPPERYHKVNPS
jgi:hypothetical protein